MSSEAAGRAELPAGAAPHVVMLVGNDVTTDNRVLKTATTLARSGARVTVVGNATSGVRSDISLGDVRILRVPLEMKLKLARQKKRGRRRQRRFAIVGWGSKSEHAAAKVRPLARLRESRGGPMAQRWESFTTFVVRARGGVQRRIDGLTRHGWRAWDGVWARTALGVRWRRVTPELRDFELGFGPVIDALEPDVIHAHDFHMVNVATLASRRAAAAGRTVPWIYDAHEFVPGMATYGGKTKRVIAAYAKAEKEYAHDASSVITVSPFIAVELQKRHRLPALPSVVFNAPAASDGSVEGGTDVRAAAGVGPDVPLLVYSGGVTPARGIDVVVQALAQLPEVHLAVVCVPGVHTKPVEKLVSTALDLGVRDRMHLLEPVGPERVTTFLRTADIGVHPLPGGIPNHDMALPNKLFEYLQAGLPLVVSDAKALADFVTSHKVGASFRTGDATSLAAAVRRVLDDRASYAAEVAHQRDEQQYTWEGQEQTLVDVYNQLLGTTLAVPHEPFKVGKPKPYRRSQDGIVLGIGPANSAGQGWAWAKAAERYLDGVTCEVLAVEKDTYDYPSDVVVPAADFARGREWQLAYSAHVTSTWTHALLEAGRPVIGTLNGRDFSGDVEMLRASGITVGLVFHGSEIRDPRRHAAGHAWSPFLRSNDGLTERLQQKYDELAPVVAAFDGPTFVSTPDLLDYLPDAHWLPLVVDTSIWTPKATPLERPVPVIVHAPSNTALKGTQEVEAVLVPLHEKGLVEYRRIQGVPPSQVGDLLADADVVIDQLLLGGYGVLACEGAALGRVVVGHLGDRVREAIPGDVPIIEANPDDLGTVIERILDERDAARDAAARGPEFIAAFHDGHRSAEVLAEHLLRR